MGNGSTPAGGPKITGGGRRPPCLPCAGGPGGCCAKVTHASATSIVNVNRTTCNLGLIWPHPLSCDRLIIHRRPQSLFNNSVLLRGLVSPLVLGIPVAQMTTLASLVDAIQPEKKSGFILCVHSL